MSVAGAVTKGFGGLIMIGVLSMPRTHSCFSTDRRFQMSGETEIVRMSRVVVVVVVVVELSS